MRHHLTIALAGVVVLCLAGCGGQPPADTGFRPTATIQDIMDSIVDPSADAIWESVATTVDAEGIHEEFPETDEDWDGVRRDVIRVLEATNLLLVPGRRVADPGVTSENPDIELEPEEMQMLIDADRDKFVDLAHGLYDMAMLTMAAVNDRDTQALMDSGQGLDIACERCHLNYWYPNDEEARRLFEENERYYLESIGEGEPQ